ncbi:MAG TPA: DeoR/GlpR family DNA-binding transcription regulator [Beutenbergiaceae bacterium]|nr:DeoR/GlpR family DNA-binding transcription regulator [Beutenbergiaceae bacterium]
MLVHERRQRILEAVRRRGSVSVTTLAEELNVSGMTIRRDLDSLASEGKLDKVHGGATLRRGSTTQELDFDLTSEHNLEEKDAIGELAATMVTPGMSVGISAGSTMWSFTGSSVFRVRRREFLRRGEVRV